jgi:hypothetical protein
MSAPEPLAGKTLVAYEQGLIHGNALYLPVYIVGPEGRRARMVGVFDTGADETTLYPGTALQAGLPHGADIEVRGVGGTTPAYTSTMGLVVGGVRLEDEACFVVGDTPDPLVGFGAWRKYGYTVIEDSRTGEVWIYR